MWKAYLEIKWLTYCRDGIVLFRAKNLQSKFEDSQVKYEGGADKGAIDTWITKN